MKIYFIFVKNLKNITFEKFKTNNKLDLGKIVTVEDANYISRILQIRDFLTEVVEGDYQPHDTNGIKNFYAIGQALGIVDYIDNFYGINGINEDLYNEIKSHIWNILVMAE